MITRDGGGHCGYRFGVALLFVFLALCSHLNSVLPSGHHHRIRDQVNYKGHRLIRITVDPGDDGLKDILNTLGADVWKRGKLNNREFPVSVVLDVLIGPNSYRVLEKYLAFNNITHSVVLRNAQLAMDRQRHRNGTRGKRSYQFGGFHFNQYHTLNEIDLYLKYIEDVYNHVDIYKIGRTFEKREIVVVRIYKESEAIQKPAILLEFGAHAHEWLSPAVGLAFINELATKYEKDADVTSLVRKYDWYVIPVANPDGYVYSWIVDRMWRKNRVRTRNEGCPGVDINRNFDNHFQAGGGRYCTNDYSGEMAFSEEETLAMRDLALSLRGRLSAYFSVHSYGELVSYPYSYTTDPTYDRRILAELATMMATEMNKAYGGSYKAVNIAKGLYEVQGTSVDWMYDSVGVNCSLAVELRDDGKFGFLLPPEQITETFREFFNGVSKLANIISA